MTPHVKTSEPQRTIKLQCRIATMREKLGHSQRAFAKLCNTTSQTLSNVERGYTLSLELALRIARQLQIPVESIWSLPVAKKRSKK